MRYCRFSVRGQARDGVVDAQDRLVDLAAAGVPPESLPAWAAADQRIDRIVRAQPPREAVFAPANVRMLPPCAAARVVVRGGATADLQPAVVAPGAMLPQGQWSPGVGAVVLAPGDGRIAWERLVAGWMPLHLVDTTLACGPWIVGADEVRDVRHLMFSAFVDDAPVVRPAKALLDWGAVLAQAHAAQPLRQGDVIAVVAPPRAIEAGAELRAALVVDGQVRARLVNRVAGQRPGAISAEAAPDEAPPAPDDASPPTTVGLEGP